MTTENQNENNLFNFNREISSEVEKYHHIAKVNIWYGDLEKAYNMMSELSIQDDIKQIFNEMKCVKFWLIREQELKEITTIEMKSHFLEEQWELFESFLKQENIILSSKVLFLFRHYVYTKVLKYSLSHLQKLPSININYLIKIVEIFLSLRDYFRAKEVLFYARKYEKYNTKVQLYLAKCYFSLGEKDKSLSYYQTSFLGKIPQDKLSFFNNQYLQEMIDLVYKNGHNPNECLDWLPVYMIAKGYFKSIPPIQKNHKQKIEKDIHRIPSRNKLVNVPFLLYRYLCLLDYYIKLNQPGTHAIIKQYLNIVQECNQTIYNYYKETIAEKNVLSQ